MDLQTAALQCFTTGRPCAFVQVDHATRQSIEITVHPNGRVSGRPLGRPESEIEGPTA
jgi:hypothetical protein